MFYDFEHIDQILPQILFSCNNQKIRKTISYAVLAFCTLLNNEEEIEITPPKLFFLKILIPQLQGKLDSKYEDFFVCLSQIVLNIPKSDLNKLLDVN